MPGPARELQRFVDQRREQVRERHLADTVLAAVPDVVLPAFDGQSKLAKGLRLWLNAGAPTTGTTAAELRDTLTDVEKAPRPGRRRR